MALSVSETCVTSCGCDEAKFKQQANGKRAFRDCETSCCLRPARTFLLQHGFTHLSQCAMPAAAGRGMFLWDSQSLYARSYSKLDQ